MLDESYVLEYKGAVLEDMSEEKRAIFEGPLKKFVISTTRIYDTNTICFHLYQDHFLAAVAKWPWLLCSNLGAHLARSLWDHDEEKATYQQATQGIYGPRPPFYVKRKAWKP